jgi:signal transduction histidine kinase/CheY-like chemotaxis protein
MPQSLAERLRLLHTITDVLLHADTLDDLCRRAVELAHSRLGYPRVGIWLTDPDPEYMCGSFGISEEGVLRDERDRRFHVPNWHHLWLGVITAQEGVTVRYNEPLKDDLLRVVGRGTTAVAPLWNGRELLGGLCVDDLTRPGAIGPEDVQVLEIFATSLGHLCSLKRAEETLRQSEESQRLLAERLEALQHINNELSKAATESDLCLLAVTLGHERLGLPRLSIWLLVHPPTFVRGTFGVSETGEVRDEHSHEHEARSPLLVDVLGDGARFAKAENQPLRNADGQAVGTGTQMAAALWDGEQVTGALTVDDLGRPGALDAQMDRIVPLFATAIGHLCSLKRAEEERRKLERQVQQAQKLESLGVLAGGIAHDFNNLLTGILGNTEMALQDAPPASPVRENLTGIESAARRAADLASQMLAYSGKGAFLIEPLDLTVMIEDMSHLLRAAVPPGVALRSRLARDLPTVEADVSQIRQVVISLFSNAVEALAEQGGAVTIASGVLECDREYLAGTDLDEGLRPGPYAFFEITDNGSGMSPETRARVFDPFFSTKFTGRGLGLAAALGIVRGHHGAIKVSSELGKGTAVKVLLPVSGNPARPADAIKNPARAQSPAPGGTVLLVDDEETVRTVGKHMLEYLGYSVLTANDGVEAVAVFREHAAEIACVVLDLTMPNMDGRETFGELHRLRDDLPIVMSSGYNEMEVTERFAGKGVAGFIQKPYRSSELAAVLRGALAGSGSASEDDPQG